MSELRGRAVLVTGHTGFIGSWLVLWLHHLGARISGYALPPATSPALFDAARLRELLAAHTLGDVRDAPGLGEAVHAADPEVIFHLAAQPLVRASYRDPTETFSTNVLGTAHLLDAVRKRGKPCVVLCFTSDKCYDNSHAVWGLRECDPLGGRDPYSASKACEELVAGSFRASFFPPDRLKEHGVTLLTVRAGNVLGGGDWAADRIVPDIARSLAAGSPVPIRNPQATRPWQHVLEPLAGCIELVERALLERRPEWCTSWNLGPLAVEDRPVSDLVGLAIQTWGSGSWEYVGRTDQLPEASALRLSIDRALTHLQWRPRWPVETAVARTIRWYREFLEAERLISTIEAGAAAEVPAARKLCELDLAEYLSDTSVVRAGLVPARTALNGPSNTLLQPLTPTCALSANTLKGPLSP